MLNVFLNFSPNVFLSLFPITDCFCRALSSCGWQLSPIESRDSSIKCRKRVFDCTFSRSGRWKSRRKASSFLS